MALFKLTQETDRLAWLAPDYSSNPMQALTPYLELDIENRTLSIGLKQQAERGVPIAVHDGRVRRYYLAETTDAVELTRAINTGEFDGLFSAILDGTEVVWNGNSHVGRPSKAARQAEEELEAELATYAVDDGIGGLWEAAEYHDATDIIDTHGLTAETTDGECVKLAARLETDARAEGVVLWRTAEWLKELRDESTD